VDLRVIGAVAVSTAAAMLVAARGLPGIALVGPSPGVRVATLVPQA
jgi:hypothetical protein